MIDQDTHETSNYMFQIRITDNVCALQTPLESLNRINASLLILRRAYHSRQLMPRLNPV